ncbi:hypothetical protein [Flavobacterium kingsejongi]|uniref:SH3b domain-containing protein n=1 Tax=Flavobacterium kingsejongi TaxID=1678728 RepID=A0A2S1LPB6_9FLAO|nr:hypothetical protein [Flavobacterium kingsejongi]AWG25595.1 hypothetical protein FK004_10315 [Flavobacterium kingsejongi]
MKKNIALAFLSFLMYSCATYDLATVNEDTKIYSSRDNGLSEITVIPKDSYIYVKGSKAYKKVKSGIYEGWAYNPVYTSIASGVTTTTHTTLTTTTKSSSSSSTSSSQTKSDTPSAGKSVHVKGYTRKDGTYVKPHTRSSPGRRR